MRERGGDELKGARAQDGKEKDVEEGERKRKENRKVRRMTGERVTGRRRPAPARTSVTWARPGDWRQLDPLPGVATMLGLRARCTGGCTPPLPRRPANCGLRGWATTLAAGALPMDSCTAPNAQAWSIGGEDAVQGRAAGARVHGMFACRIEKFAGRKKRCAARRRRSWAARFLHTQQQEAVREVLLWMLPAGAGPTCSTPSSPSPSSIGSSTRQRLLIWRSTG